MSLSLFLLFLFDFFFFFFFQQIARDVLMESESEHKWKQLGDSVLEEQFDLSLAEDCFTRANDLSSLLLLATSRSDRKV